MYFLYILIWLQYLKHWIYCYWFCMCVCGEVHLFKIKTLTLCTWPTQTPSYIWMNKCVLVDQIISKSWICKSLLRPISFDCGIWIGNVRALSSVKYSCPRGCKVNSKCQYSLTGTTTATTAMVCENKSKSPNHSWYLWRQVFSKSGFIFLISNSLSSVLAIPWNKTVFTEVSKFTLAHPIGISALISWFCMAQPFYA